MTATTLPTAPPPGGAPPRASERWLIAGATACTLVVGILAASYGARGLGAVLGVLIGAGLIAAAAYRPIFATYL
ncbi:MAG: hypothetical protein ACRDRM_10435, partial [Pseudonocardiaceae bacterium]